MKLRAIKLFFVAIACSIASLSANAAIINVDIGADGQQVQTGYEELTQVFLGTFDGVSITLSGVGTQGFRDRGDVNGVLGDLAEDFFFATTSITLVFENLAAGNYSFTSWHHDSDYTQSFLNIISSGTSALNFQATTGNNPGSFTSGTAFFSSDGSGTETIQFTTASKVRNNASAIILNGFSVTEVTAPASLSVFLLGFIGMALRRKN